MPASSDKPFFPSLVEHLARVLGADYAFVGALTPGKTDQIRTIAAHAHGRPAANFEYELTATPCENVLTQSTCVYPRDVQQQFPNDPMLAKLGVHAYAGTPLVGIEGKPIGLIVALFCQPLEREDAASSLEVFAALATGELERVRADQTMRLSQEMLNKAQEVAHIGSWWWDIPADRLICSRELLRLYGLPPDLEGSASEIMARISEAIHPDDRAMVLQKVEQAIANGHAATPFEYRVTGRDGRLRVVLAYPEVVTDAAGRTVYSYGALQDITARKRAELALQESETRYRTIVETAQEGIWTFDADCRTTFVNHKMGQILEYRTEEMLGKSLFDFMDEEGRVLAAQAVDRCRQGIAEPHVLKFIRRDNRVVWAELNASPLNDEAGGYAGALAMVNDITDSREAERLLRESEGRYRHLFENMTSGFALHEIICDAQGNPVDYRYLQANPAFERLTGVPVATLIGKRIREILPNTEDYWIENFGRVALTGEPMAYENFSRELGKYYDTWVFSPQKNQFAVIFSDVTQRKLMETEKNKLSSAIEQTADSVMITDREGVIEYVNPAFERGTGFTAAEAIGRTPRLVKSGKQDQLFFQKMWDIILSGEVFSDVLINRRKDGSFYYEEKTITPLKNADGEITHFISTGKDVTERMHAQEKIIFMAQHDALTALPNRALLLDRLKQSIARARWHRRLVAVLFVDLDRFKTINDTLGHETGDLLLQRLGERFGGAVREGDTVARFGGDEFVILLGDLASDNDISVVAQKVLDALNAPFTIESQSLYITASIGISLFPNDGEDGTTLLKNADIAMYRAKELGKNTYQFYSADMSARAFERLSLENNLRRALERQEFVLHYQRQMDTTSEKIFGCEALLRWQHPELGLVPPSEFIALLEETGLIVPAGEWVLRTAAKQIKEWHSAGHRDLRLAVNLSPRQAQSPGLLTTVQQVLADTDGDPGWLELEITEGLLVQQSPALRETFDALRRMGVRLAIDDFGVGYSSLSYLRRLPIDTLKIDRTFVRDVPADADDCAITTTIIAMAQNLRLEVIAEGVERPEQRQFLGTYGCSRMQGYLFSRPESAATISDALASGG